MTFVKMVIRNLDGFKRDMKKADGQRKYAAFTAVRVEGYSLMKDLKSEIRAGAPGGVPFSPLTQMALRTGKPRNRSPLKKLAVPIRYRSEKKGNGYSISIGFVDPGRGKVLSKSWKRLANLLQTGGKTKVTEKKRKSLIAMGARMSKRKSTRRSSNVFFLRKTTREFDIPGRPILDPFWRNHKERAKRNIQRNFERKMGGERI